MARSRLAGGSPITALSASDQRRYVKASMVASVGFACAIAGRFVLSGHVHGARVTLGWVLVAIGAVIALFAMALCTRLLLRGRRLQRSGPVDPGSGRL